MAAALGIELEIESLENTVSTIKAVLRDAEAKGVLSYQEQHFVERLKDAVSKADDLIDEFRAEQKQQQHHLDEKKASKKVCLHFSRFFGDLGVAYKMSKKVKKIRKELEAIADDAKNFSFRIKYQPIRRKREETRSYVNGPVIGREKETEEIVNRLLSPEVAERGVPVLAIVGMEGIGKTTLAQLIFHHERVKKEFELRSWVCVADQDQDQLPVQEILAKFFEFVTKTRHNGYTLQRVQEDVQKQLQGKKCLIILDDVWTENHYQWLCLSSFLMEGGRGSRVVVTTRSNETAKAVGNHTPYELKGLSDDNSWSYSKSVHL